MLRLAVAALALAAGLCVPVRLSADVWAYAAYGALVTHGIDPYARAYRTADLEQLHDPLLNEALRAWNGSLPRDVYGPLFTVPCAAVVALTRPLGPQAAILALRSIAALGLLACVALAGRSRPRLATLLAFQPVVLWGAAEGHNDTWWLALILAADRFAATRAKVAFLTAAAAVKAVALVPLVWFLARDRSRGRTLRAMAAGLALFAAYAPLGWSVVTRGFDRGLGPPRISLVHAGALAAWSASPIPIILALALGALGISAVVRAIRSGDRTTGAVLLGWLALPAPEPWYAIWFLPVIAAAGRTPAALALFVAGLTGVAGYLQDLAGGTALHDPALLGAIMLALYALPLLLGVLAPIAQQAPSVPTPPPLVSPSPVPSATPAPSGTPSPSPTQNPFSYIVAPSPGPAGAPRIVEIAVNDKVLHPGGLLVVRVTTSPDVTGMVARSMGHEIAIPLASAGVFAGQQQLPGSIPFFYLNRTFQVDFVATTADGRSASASLPMRIER